MAACTQYDAAWKYLADFSGRSALDAIGCAFSADWGLGMGPTFMLFVFGFLGLALTVRTRHPGPVVVAAMLSAGTIAASIPGIAVKVMAFVIFIGFAAAAFFIYQRAQGAL
jgi:uncharacterized membrane protein